MGPGAHSPRRSRLVGFATATAVTILFGGTLRAGPKDQSSKFPVGIEVGGHKTGGIHDSGGVTTLSFDDAKKAGLIDDKGDPTRKPDGSGERGTGASFVKYNFFNNVKINVTPAKADGTRNGDTREVETTVYVPKKPADQDGPTDADKMKKTNSVTNKLGANVVGSTIGGGKLEIVDTPTGDPLKDARSTKWSNASPPGPIPADHTFALVVIPRFDTHAFAMPGVSFNSVVLDPEITTLPVTMIPGSIASLVGLKPVGMFTLDFEEQSSLFVEGFLGTPPGNGPLSLPFGYLDIALPAADGSFEVRGVAALINSESDRLLLGGNGLVPDGYAGWLDSDTSRFNLRAVPEPSSLVLALTGIAAMAIAAGGARGRASARPGPPPLRGVAGSA